MIKEARGGQGDPGRFMATLRESRFLPLLTRARSLDVSTQAHHSKVVLDLCTSHRTVVHLSL